MLDELPQRILKDPWHEELSRDPNIHDAIKEFLGFDRDVPGEILDIELIDMIWQTMRLKKWTGRQVGRYVKSIASLEERAQGRAVLINLSRMKRENGGRFPWEQ